MKKLLILFAFLSFFCVTIPAFGQQNRPNLPSQIINIGPNGPATPISGVAVLAVLGGGYAIKNCGTAIVKSEVQQR